jgi:hypothetical protein
VRDGPTGEVLAGPRGPAHVRALGEKEGRRPGWFAGRGKREREGQLGLKGKGERGEGFF